MEDGDYDKGLAVYNRKLNEFNRLVQQRLRKDKTENDKLRVQRIADSVEFERIERARQLMEARNRRIRKENIETEKQNKEIEAYNRSTYLLRTFQVDGFGVWNIDRLKFADAYGVTAIFRDSLGNELNLKDITVIEKNTNGIWRFPDNNIKLFPATSTMIIGTNNFRIVYVSYKEFEKYDPTPGSTQIFVVKLVPESEHNYMRIKSLMLQ